MNARVSRGPFNICERRDQAAMGAQEVPPPSERWVGGRRRNAALGPPLGARSPTVPHFEPRRPRPQQRPGVVRPSVGRAVARPHPKGCAAEH